MNQEQMREQRAFQYTAALEEGDLETVTGLLAEAEQDPELDRMIEEINEVYRAELAPASKPLAEMVKYAIMLSRLGKDARPVAAWEERHDAAPTTHSSTRPGTLRPISLPRKGPMGTLHIQLFGGLVLERDGQSLPAPTPQKAALLLAYLLTAYNRSHPRTLLAGLFWGDLPESRARRNLSGALWSIRSVLEADAPADDSPKPVVPPVLLTEGDTIRCNPDADLALDVRDFEALLANPDDVEAQERAIELYRGELLVGYYDDWILLERERLRQMYLAALNRLIPAYKARGAWDAAVGAAQRLVQDDPYQEEATRELMRLYYRQGRRDKALHQFATLKATLQADLGLEPETETVALCQLMQAGQVLSAPDYPAAAPPRPGRPALGTPPATTGASALQALSTLRTNLRDVPLVGRQREQDRLAAWLADPQPQPPMLVIQGEAGVGKTRLAEEAVEEAYRNRMLVLWGHYHPLSAPLPYGGLIEAMRVGLQLGGPPTLEPIWLSEVSRLLPELCEIYPTLPPPITLPPDQERTRLWEALTRYLLALAASGPHMFVLEDVQWVDPATLDLLQYALPRLRSSGAGLRLLATTRSEDMADAPGLEAALRGLEAQGMLDYLPLERLDAEGVGELVRQALGLATPARRFSEHLWKETEGNPFFALETIRFWTERGALVQQGNGGWETPGVDASDYARLPTPASVRRVLEQRLARLTPAARTIIEVGAVIGRQVPERVLWRSSGTTIDAILGPAEELLRHHLWVEAQDGHGYEFAHQKVIEVAYTGISGPRRRHLHRLAATALESEYPAEVERLAHHWLAAEDPARALPYLQQAAERAEATFAYDEALAFYNQAVAAIDQIPAADVREMFDLVYRVLAGRGDLGVLLRRLDQAQRDLDRLVALAREADQPGLVADALARRTAVANVQSRYADVLSDLQEALHLAQTPQSRLARARILLELARVHQNVADYVASVETGDEALALYRELGDVRQEVGTLTVLAASHGLAGNPDRAVQILEEALEKVRLIANSQPQEARILNNLSMFVSSPQTGHDLFRRCLEIAEQTRMIGLQTTALQNLAFLLTRFGQPAEALPYLQRAYEEAERAGAMHGLGMQLMTRGRAQAMLGKHPAARADLKEAVRILESLGARGEVMTAYLDLGHYLLDRGEFESGLGHIEKSYALWRELGEIEDHYQEAVYHAELARAYAGLRRTGAARRAVDQALARLAVARQTPTSWTDPSVEVLAQCYSVLASVGRTAEAAAVLEDGYRLMMEMADQCGPKLRASYLGDVHECRLLRAAWENRHAAASVTSDTQPTAPDESEADGKVGQRRAELRIMMRDAASRQQVLDEDELARKFDVSRRTIQRDLAALRRAGEIT